MTIKDEYKKIRKEHPHMPASQAHIWSKANVVKHIRLTLLGKDHFCNVIRNELIYPGTELYVEYRGLTVTIDVVGDEDGGMHVTEWASLERNTYDRERGWGREGMDDGEYILSSQSKLVFDENRQDVLKYAPKGMSRQLAYEWASEHMRQRERSAKEFYEGHVEYYGVIVACPDLDINESLWGIDYDGSEASREYVCETIEELYEEVVRQIDSHRKVA